MRNSKEMKLKQTNWTMSVIGGQENKSKLEEQESLNDKLDKTSWRKKSENVMTIICFSPLILWFSGGLNRS